MFTILTRFQATRQFSLTIAAHLSDEDASAQSMFDCSPTKWHLAHTTWFFETFILGEFEPDFKPHHPMFRTLFNSYYNGIGEQYPRQQRGLLTRPGVKEILHYRDAVNQRIEQLLSSHYSEKLRTLIELGIQHEQQHQELMLTDIKHLLSINPLFPMMIGICNDNDLTDHIKSDNFPVQWHRLETGLIDIGHDGAGFCFDNEMPRHKHYVAEFSIASRLVNNGEYLDFIEAGGYKNPALWLANGWSWINQQKIEHPLYWHYTDHWQEFTLHGLQQLDLHQAVSHLSFFEASAYASWAGARLPTEAEWEYAAQKYRDLPQLFGACWQWTSSSYAPYPGFAVSEGAIGEYNGKFMVDQYVLRGSSAFTPHDHARVTYRNFFPTSARWQRTGIRLAK